MGHICSKVKCFGISLSIRMIYVLIRLFLFWLPSFSNCLLLEDILNMLTVILRLAAMVVELVSKSHKSEVPITNLRYVIVILWFVRINALLAFLKTLYWRLLPIVNMSIVSSYAQGACCFMPTFTLFRLPGFQSKGLGFVHCRWQVVSTLYFGARGLGFDPRLRRGKFGGPIKLPFVSFAGMT